MNLLDDYLSLDETAKQLRKSERTILRWAQQRKIVLTYIGMTPYVHVPSLRETMRTWQTKNDKRGGRAGRGRTVTI